MYIIIPLVSHTAARKVRTRSTRVYNIEVNTCTAHNIIDKTSPGVTVYVYRGIYYHHVDVGELLSYYNTYNVRNARLTTRFLRSERILYVCVFVYRF